MLWRTDYPWWSIVLIVALTTVAAAPRTLCARCHDCVSHSQSQVGVAASLSAYFQSDADSPHHPCPQGRHCRTSRFSMVTGGSFARNYEGRDSHFPFSVSDRQEEALRGTVCHPNGLSSLCAPSALAMRTRLGSLLC